MSQRAEAKLLYWTYPASLAKKKAGRQSFDDQRINIIIFFSNHFTVTALARFRGLSTLRSFSKPK
ncbi:MAG: hypothetical protein UV69_C0014G0006 [Parcubacteria group bacterium GW2011_GWE2_43_12]|nr:MAG: hypothetical protein UV69_C0014G0006 [Parcubacteria group bacterium GW2011_GWE2_43_12]